jgi:dihydrofolate reductase
MQTKFIAYVATSIDGRIAKNSSSAIDWTSKEDWIFFQNSLAKMDSVVVGQNTYRVSMSQLRKRKTIVLTSKVSKPKTENNVVFFNPARSDLKKFLSGKNYKKVAILGGARVYDFFLKNKMLDELFVTIEPYVFTNGVPMFFGDKFQKYRFSLQSIKKLNKRGTILLKYKNDD